MEDSTLVEQRIRAAIERGTIRTIRPWHLAAVGVVAFVTGLLLSTFL